MATKTISVDIEAYERLKSVQKDNESFSQTIKRVIRKPMDFDQWLESIEKSPLSDEAVEAVEQVVAQRRDPRNGGVREGGAREGGARRGGTGKHGR
jgi:predicted CopG family antitoxin